MSSFDDEIRRVAAGLFHIGEFRPFQKEIILSILEKQHTLAVLPTGAGKSVTFQIPALILGGLTLVVSPLISLMKDQVRVLRERGIAGCEYLSSDRAEEEKRNIMNRLGEWNILYVTPERLESANFIRRLSESGARLSLVVIDEAHCVSLWGGTFRPSYRKIKHFTAKFPGTVVAAFTGTASAQLREDVRAGLGIKKWNVIASSVARDNLSISVRYVMDKTAYLLEQLRTCGNTVVYTTSRFACDRLHYRLNHLGYPAAIYHAGLAREDRDKNQEAFVSGKKSIMVATSAFGMGIDKPDIRGIWHFNIVPEAEEYYQEVGRAGRDGKESRAVTLVSPGDMAVLDQNIDGGYPPWPEIERMRKGKNLLPSDTERMEAICTALSLGEFGEIAGRKKDYLAKRETVLRKALFMKRFVAGSGCRKTTLLSWFGEEAEECGKCDYCEARKNGFYRERWTEQEMRLTAALGRRGVSLEEVRERVQGLKKGDKWKSGFGTLRGTDMQSFGGIVCGLKNHHVVCLGTEAGTPVVLNPLFVKWLESVSPFSFF